MRTLVVIPARHASSRFPGKPLHVIRGATLLERVVEVARRACARHRGEYLVATDHEAIGRHCDAIGVRWVMTPARLASGTDRVHAALEACRKEVELVLNLQGDAPFTPPEHLERLIEAAAAGDADVITPVVRLDWPALDRLRERKRESPSSGTTCVCDERGRALWFSKAVLPAIRDEGALRGAGPWSPVLRHVGLYAYTPDALARFVTLPCGRYERLEGLEQLRFLENGMRVRVVEVEPAAISMSGIDSPADAALAERLIDEHGDPMQGG